MKKLLPLAFVILLGACTQMPDNSDGTSSSSRSSTVSQNIYSSSSMSSISGSVQTFTDSIRQFAISYPSNFTIVANDNVAAEDYTVTGTSFVFPDSYAIGNTLNEAKVNVAVQPKCPTLSSATTTDTVTKNGVTYATADWNGVGAGNLYQGRTYTTMHDNSCFILTLYMHSCNLGPDCYAGHTTPFDKQPLITVFENMVSSFKFLP